MCGKIFRLSITQVSRLQAGSSFDLPNLATLQRARSAGHGAQGRELYDEEHNYRCGHSVATIAELQTINRRSYTIKEKAPTRAFSWLKVPTSSFTF